MFRRGFGFTTVKSKEPEIMAVTERRHREHNQFGIFFTLEPLIKRKLSDS